MKRSLEAMEGRLHAMAIAFGLLLREVARTQERVSGQPEAEALIERMLRKMERHLPSALGGFEQDGNDDVSQGFEEQMELLRTIAVTMLD